jgi:hypothetical protein
MVSAGFAFCVSSEEFGDVSGARTTLESNKSTEKK